MSRPRKTRRARVAIGDDVASAKALVDRAEVVGELAILTVLYTTNDAFKAVIDEFVASGADLAKAQKKVNRLEAVLAKARGDRDAQQNVTQRCHGAAVKLVERLGKTAADVEACGFVPLEIVKTGTTPPTGIAAAFDPVTRAIDLHVKYPPGWHRRRCIIEICAGPSGDGPYERIDGDGVKRSLAGYSPGTYWIRAATSVSEGRSDWAGPVAVIVT